MDGWMDGRGRAGGYGMELKAMGECSEQEAGRQERIPKKDPVFVAQCTPTPAAVSCGEVGR